MRGIRLSTFALATTIALIAPATASAWEVTATVHGAGAVTETTPRALMDCEVSPNGRSESSTTNCVAGTPTGLYSSGDIVNLRASVPTEAFNRGWRFEKWVDGGSNRINCDPQGTTGNHTQVDCQFQIFQNLSIDLYFDDTSGPQNTSIGSKPSAVTNSSTASFTFDATDDPDAAFQCKLDRPGNPGSYATCGGPLDKSESYSSLTADGSYTFSVRGVDPSGNADPTPATHTWTIDQTPPGATVNSGPSGLTGDSTPTFTFSSESTATLTCSIDNLQPTTSCGTGSGSFTPTLAISDGPHTFYVRATDGAGNVSNASRSFTVDTTPPETVLDSGSTGPTNDNSPSFEFSSSSANSTFTCALDAGSPTACNSGAFDSPLLADGEHTFTVFATDQAGNADPSPASATFTIDTIAPLVEITRNPKSTVRLRKGKRKAVVTYRFEAQDPGGTGLDETTCQISGGPEQPCQDSITYKLPKGRYDFTVAASDQAGNEAVTGHSFRVKRQR